MSKRKTSSEPGPDGPAPEAAEAARMPEAAPEPAAAAEAAPAAEAKPAPEAADDGLHRPGDLADEAHGPDDHGETDGHDDHAHAGEALGPIDVQAWGALALGVGAGLLVVLCLVISTSLLAPTPV